MSRTTLTIAYDGPALWDHAMDVRDLAPAMLSVGQLFDAANAVLNGDTARVKVQVKATEPGCFQITFEVVQTLTEHLITLLTGPAVTATANLVGLVVGVPAVGIGLIKFILLLRGRKIDEIKPLADNNVRVTVGDTHIDIPATLLRLYQDVNVRSAIQKIVEEPLKKDGVDSFDVRENQVQIVKVSKTEAAFFARPQIPDSTLFE